MSIYLFTDYGAADIYVGQVKSVLHEHAPNIGVIDLLHEAPVFNVKASAHLLAALSGRLPLRSVTLAVVDPGVGCERQSVILLADGKSFVGPDNGLLSVVAARAQSARIFPITWMPEPLSASFHGRDLFAPVAGRIASGALGTERLESTLRLDVEFGADDLAEIIYIDHYGNACTGVRASNAPRDARIVVGDHWIRFARVFSEVQAGETFWYENSLGLVEIAANSASAAARLGLRIGGSLAVKTG